MPATLDHKHYPHIFDTILSQAPRASLLSLRPTSSSVCAKVDRLLSRHLIIESVMDVIGDPTSTGNHHLPLLLYSPQGRLPFYQPFWNSAATSFVWHTPDGLPPAETASRDHARVASALQGTRVADVMLGDREVLLSAALAPLLPNLRTLRLPDPIREAPPSLLSPLVCTLVTHLSLPRKAYPVNITPSNGVRRFVIHLTTSLESRSAMFDALPYLPATTREVVIVFHDTSGQRSRKPRSNTVPPPPGILGVLAQRMAHITHLAVPRTYTLVDAHEVDPAAFGFREVTLERAELEHRLAEALAGEPNDPRIPLLPPEMFDFERKVKRRDAVRFLSKQEYRVEAAEGEDLPYTQYRHWAVDSNNDQGYEVKSGSLSELGMS